MLHLPVSILREHHTGLPTKNETSETTLQNSYFLFPYIHVSPQLLFAYFVAKSFNKPKKTKFNREKLVKPGDRNI